MGRTCKKPDELIDGQVVRYCNKCGDGCGLGDFYARYRTCKECVRARQRSRNRTPDARRREYDRGEARRATPEFRRKIADQARDRTYSLAPGQYDAMLAAQSGVCAICKLPPIVVPNKRGGAFARLWVDHDHVTGEVRALLCFKCNSLLGTADEDPVRLLAAIAYLAAYSTTADNRVAEAA